MRITSRRSKFAFPRRSLSSPKIVQAVEINLFHVYPSLLENYFAPFKICISEIRCKQNPIASLLDLGKAPPVFNMVNRSLSSPKIVQAVEINLFHVYPSLLENYFAPFKICISEIRCKQNPIASLLDLGKAPPVFNMVNRSLSSPKIVQAVKINLFHVYPSLLENYFAPLKTKCETYRNPSCNCQFRKKMYLCGKIEFPIVCKKRIRCFARNIW